MEVMQEQETHNPPDISNSHWKNSTPRLPEVSYSPKCSNTKVDWYVGMATNPPPVDPKVEMPFELCGGEDAILEQTSLQ